MKRLFLATVAVSLLVAAMAMSGNQKQTTGELDIQTDKRNPWTSLKLNNSPDTFHFAVVSDRTGGHRPRVFSLLENHEVDLVIAGRPPDPAPLRIRAERPNPLVLVAPPGLLPRSPRPDALARQTWLLRTNLGSYRSKPQCVVANADQLAVVIAAPELNFDLADRYFIAPGQTTSVAAG